MIMSVIHMAAPQGEKDVPQGEKDGKSWQEVLSAGYCVWKYRIQFCVQDVTMHDMIS